jgi:hypothetical protein
MTSEITAPIGLTLDAARNLRDVLDMEIAHLEAMPPPPPDRLTVSYPGLRRESLDLTIAEIAERHGGRVGDTGYSLSLDVREVTIDFDVALESERRLAVIDELIRAGVANVEYF